MKYYLGIDQGGSKTEALIFNDHGQIFAFADDRDIRKPGDLYSKMQGYWIRYATEKALKKAGNGLMLSDLSGACCALNGADWPSDYIRLRKLVSNALSMDECNVRIVNDCIGAMRGGSDSGNRAVICMGTGMNSAVRAADGREYIYGYFITAADQGGRALGGRAWGSILDAYNGLGKKTLLTDLTLNQYNEISLVELFEKITTNVIPFEYYDMCPILMRAAKENDAIAIDILENSAGRLVSYIEEGAKKLGLSETNVTLVLAGGVFKGDGDVLFNMMQRIIGDRNLDIDCVKPIYEPVAGSALLLLDDLSEIPRDEALKRFDSYAEKFKLKIC